MIFQTGKMKSKSILFFIATLFFIFSKNSEAQMAQYYSLDPQQAYCSVGHSITITMMYLNKNNQNVIAAENGSWSVNGQPIGKIDPASGYLKTTDLTLAKVIYTAPDKIPSANPVAISVSFKPDPSITTYVTLVCNITIVDSKNYFSLNGDQIADHLFEFDERASYPGMNKAIVMGGGLKMSLNGFMKHNEHTPASLSMTLLINGTNVGTYPWQVNDDNPQTNTMVTLGGANYKGINFSYASGECDPPHTSDCKVVSLKGSTTITKFDTNTKQVEGYFSGTVTTMDSNGNYQYEKTEGGFTAELMDMSGVPVPQQNSSNH